MIITCPNCGRRFNLERTPPTLFRCPKCAFTVPFNIVLNGQGGNLKKDVTNSDELQQTATVDGPSLPTDGGQRTCVVEDLQNKTRVVEGLGGDSAKTKMVASLQRKSRALLQMTYGGRSWGVINLPHGKPFNLGRNSADSNAQVKLTPDKSMSRIHAGMRTLMGPNGNVLYQITSAKNDNPVYVNNVPIPKGKACTLKSGDTIRMGDTTILFRQM